MIKISIITKTFRIHDNPFLDSDLYIILIDANEYGENQTNFLVNILNLHLADLDKLGIKPVIADSYKKIYKIIKNNIDEYEIFIDHINPKMNLPIEKCTYIPTWCLIDWTDKVEKIKIWFLPQALGNHKVFKEFVVKNKRKEYKIKYIKKNYEFNKYFKNIQLFEKELPITFVRLPKKDLDKWILKNLKNTKFIQNIKWFKPDTCPTTKISDNDECIDDIYKTSKLSPFISLGVLSPLTMYNYYTGEDRMGSGRDQVLFREMFHACAQIPEYWNDNFGQEYDWKKKTKIQWENYINGNTGHKDLDWAMRLLKKEGWIHHLARHMVAEYLTRGNLEIHWKYGMEWFKNTLVDHDDCVNRGNWMWLSGTAFSTKQRSFYHYSPEKYLENRNKKLKIKCMYIEN
jgi:deoxyribodipyrimidine photolyase